MLSNINSSLPWISVAKFITDTSKMSFPLPSLILWSTLHKFNHHSWEQTNGSFQMVSDSHCGLKCWSMWFFHLSRKALDVSEQILLNWREQEKIVKKPGSTGYHFYDPNQKNLIRPSTNSYSLFIQYTIPKCRDEVQ